LPLFFRFAVMSVARKLSSPRRALTHQICYQRVLVVS
jgi:hypothetical protein